MGKRSMDSNSSCPYGTNERALKSSNDANLGFEGKMWKAADKLRNNMDAAEHKHVVLGVIFLKYIYDAFKEVARDLFQTSFG